MIRGGGFGNNFETKLYMTLIALFAVIYDWKVKKRTDYWFVFLIGTVIWGGVELSLQIAGTRVVVQNYLFGLPLSVFSTALLRGTSEGAVIAIIGVFFGDRLLDSKDRKWSIVGFILLNLVIVLMVLQQYQPTITSGENVPSRREIFTPVAVIFMILMIIIDLYWYFRSDSITRKRGLWMFYVLLLFSTIWTLTEYLCHTRWIEIMSLGSLQHADPITEFLALLYDIVVEIGFAYVPYLALPYLFRWIKVVQSNQKVR